MAVAGSLMVVGAGLRAVGHITSDALAEIEQAGRLFYVAGDPLMTAWLQDLRPDAINLAECYAEGKPRTKTYVEMEQRVLAAVRSGERVVVAFYGHPGVGAVPGHRMIEHARGEGYLAAMLPAVSADACLYADLGIDPLRPGCQSFEAWTFLGLDPQFDPRFHLLLWQVGLIYERSILSGPPNRRGLLDLKRRLRRVYPASHRVVLYEAASLPITAPRKEECALSQLDRAEVSSATTLYVPPRSSERAR